MSVKGKLRIVDGGGVGFYCPGCKQYHTIRVTGTQHPVWGFNGDYERPTFTPSILIRTGHYIPGHQDDCWCKYYAEHPDDHSGFKCSVCHSFVTDGKIQYLSDCTHEFAGQTIELELKHDG